MQPFSQDPTDRTGQPKPFFQSEQLSMPPQNPISPTGQSYQPSPYPPSRQPFAPLPPMSSSQGSYPPGEESYYNRVLQNGGPNIQYRAGTQGKLDTPPVTPKPRNGWKAATIVLAILVLILATTTTILVMSRSTTPTVPRITLGSPTVPIATPTSQITPDVTSTALAADGTITENKLLTCGSCIGGDPVRFTINTITVENGNGRMIWDITLNNITGINYTTTNESISLQTGTTLPLNATGFEDPNGPGGFEVIIRAGQHVTRQLIFAFIPSKGVEYVFSAHIGAVSGGVGVDMPFDTVNFTF